MEPANADSSLLSLTNISSPTTETRHGRAPSKRGDPMTNSLQVSVKRLSSAQMFAFSCTSCQGKEGRQGFSPCLDSRAQTLVTQFLCPCSDAWGKLECFQGNSDKVGALPQLLSKRTQALLRLIPRKEHCMIRPSNGVFSQSENSTSLATILTKTLPLCGHHGHCVNF